MSLIFPRLKNKNFKRFCRKNRGIFVRRKKHLNRSSGAKPGGWLSLWVLCVVMWVVDGNMGSVPNFMEQFLYHPGMGEQFQAKEITSRLPSTAAARSNCRRVGQCLGSSSRAAAGHEVPSARAISATVLFCSCLARCRSRAL